MNTKNLVVSEQNNMKIMSLIIGVSILLAFMFYTSSCVVIHRDNGVHRGWYKNTNNPHHPASTNPGRGNGGGNGRGRSK